MSETVTSANANADTKSQSHELKERATAVFRWMLLGRAFEDKIAKLYRGGKIVGGVYLGRGQEAFSAALGHALDQKNGDIFAGLIRDQAGRLAFGEELLDSARTYLGSARGPMRGRDGNIHRGRPDQGMPAMISHLGAMISVVNGMLLAHRYQKKTPQIVGASTIGDGGTSTGAFHEALNQAAVEKLPLVVAVADNQFAYSTPVDRQFACADLVDRAIGYGIEGVSIDGTDLLACVEAFDKAVDRARNGHGPQMVVGKLLRLAGHGEHDDASYIPEELRDQPHGGDCNELAAATLIERGWASESEIADWCADAVAQVEDSIASAQSDPVPNPYHESWQALSTRHLCEGSSQPSNSPSPPA